MLATGKVGDQHRQDKRANEEGGVPMSDVWIVESDEECGAKAV